MLKNGDREALIYSGNPSHLRRDLRTLVNSKDFSDVTFLVGDKRELIYAHKVLLSARCEMFNKMFQDCSDSKEPYILSDVSPSIFLTLVEFLYTNSCSLDDSEVFSVLSAASKFGLADLIKMCEQFLLETVTAESACELLQVAVTFGLDDLRTELLPVIEQNGLAIFESKGFQEISSDALGYILQSDNLDVDEVDLVAAVRNWATVNSVALGQPISEIARSVVLYLRLALLTPEELSELEELNRKDRLISVEQLAKAWKHLAMKTPFGSTLETTRRTGTKERKNDQ